LRKEACEHKHFSSVSSENSTNPRICKEIVKFETTVQAYS